MSSLILSIFSPLFYVSFSPLPQAPPSLLLSFICPCFFLFVFCSLIYYLRFSLLCAGSNKIAFLIDWENLNFLMYNMRELDWTNLQFSPTLRFWGSVNLYDMVMWMLQEQRRRKYGESRRDVQLACFLVWKVCSKKFPSYTIVCRSAEG